MGEKGLDGIQWWLLVKRRVLFGRNKEVKAVKEVEEGSGGRKYGKKKETERGLLMICLVSPPISYHIVD